MEQVFHESSLPRVKPHGRVRRRRDDRGRFCAVPTALLILFIVIPLVALIWRAMADPAFWPSMTKPVVREALWVTLLTTVATQLVSIAVGTPLAYLLARRQFPGKWLIDTITDLPLVLPPVTAGVALLMAFGRRGVLGPQLEVLGIELPFTMPAVVMAQVFVAGPFYIGGAKLGFASIEPEIEEAAAIDGASTLNGFRYVTLPLALPGIASGIVLCLARAVSEFGATLMFAGNFAGRTQTMSLAIMAALESDLSAALALAVLLVVMAVHRQVPKVSPPGTCLIVTAIGAVGRLDGGVVDSLVVPSLRSAFLAPAAVQEVTIPADAAHRYGMLHGGTVELLVQPLP